jgi:hypothetical protein
MSDGHYCIVKDHEVIVDFTPRGTVELLKRLFVRAEPAKRPDLPPYRLGVREPS